MPRVLTREIRVVVLLCVAASFDVATPRSMAAEPAHSKRPNVLFIAIDDLNCNVGCYGHPFAKTPQIDRLARRGVRFDRAYCQVALCNPSRTSLLSGRRPNTTRVYDNQTPPRSTLGNVVFLPEYFRQHGYFTARVGKIAHGAYERAVTWDISEDARGGKKENGGRGLTEARPPNAPPSSLPVVTWQQSDRDDAQHVDGRIARRIVELLRANRDQPFFIAAGFHKPHLPWIAPRKYFDLFSPESVLPPQEPPDVRRQFPGLALRTTRPDGAGLSERQVREAIVAYSAAAAFADAQIGLLLQTLDEQRLWDNTIVVLWGDHGWHLGDHGGLWGKLSVFEQAARVPLVVAAPERKLNAVSPRLVELLDLYPTLVDLCGLPKPSGLEGRSFAPLLSDPERSWKNAAFTQVLRDEGIMGRSVRTERWRYTEWGGPDVVELYDHDRDAYELHNLAAGPELRKTVSELRQLLASIPSTADTKPFRPARARARRNANRSSE